MLFIFGNKMKKSLLILTLLNSLHAASDSTTSAASSEISSSATKELVQAEDRLLAEKLKALQELAYTFDPQVNAINQAIDEINAEVEQRLHALREEEEHIRKFNEDLMQECHQAIEAALAPLEEERNRRRAPILEKVESLQARITQMQSDYTKGQRHPYFSRYYDAEAEMDLGFRISPIQKEIEALYAAADGDINERIEALRASIYNEYNKKIIPLAPSYSREHGLYQERADRVNPHETEKSRLNREYSQHRAAIYNEYDRQKTILKEAAR